MYNNVGFLNQNNPNMDIDPAMLQDLADENDSKQSEDLFRQGDMVKLIEKYNEVDLPDGFDKHRLKKQFWAILCKDIKLTFIEDNNDIMEFEFLFKDAELNYMMNTPSFEFSFEDEQYIDQFRLYFLAALRRSKGFSSHRFNERIIEGGTINQTIRSSTDTINQQTPKSGGFLSKFF